MALQAASGRSQGPRKRLEHVGQRSRERRWRVDAQASVRRRTSDRPVKAVASDDETAAVSLPRAAPCAATTTSSAATAASSVAVVVLAPAIAASSVPVTASSVPAPASSPAITASSAEVAASASAASIESSAGTTTGSTILEVDPVFRTSS